MALDMANSDASSAKGKSFTRALSFGHRRYLSFSARTSAIHKETFSVPLSGDEPNDLFNLSLAGLASEKNPRSGLSYRALSSYRGKKVISFLQTFFIVRNIRAPYDHYLL